MVKLLSGCSLVELEVRGGGAWSPPGVYRPGDLWTSLEGSWVCWHFSVVVPLWSVCTVTSWRHSFTPLRWALLWRRVWETAECEITSVDSCWLPLSGFLCLYSTHWLAADRELLHRRLIGWRAQRGQSRRRGGKTALQIRSESDCSKCFSVSEGWQEVRREQSQQSKTWTRGSKVSRCRSESRRAHLLKVCLYSHLFF